VRTLVANKNSAMGGAFALRPYTDDILADYSETLHLLKNPLPHDENPPPAWMIYQIAMDNACTGRSFFSTSAGRIGLGPAHSEVGDLICIFHDTYRPFIIRPRDTMSSSLLGKRMWMALCTVKRLRPRKQKQLELLYWFEVTGAKSLREGVRHRMTH
jgi:hypothetical protein